MDTNFQLVAKTFQIQHCPLQQLKRNCVFTELFESKDGKVVKKRTFQTKGEWLTWKKQVNEEMLIQRQLAQQYPDKFLQIIDYSVDTYNHKRFLFITYDCDQSAQSLFQYLHENQVNYQEQIKIVEQILQILCLLQKFNCHHANLKPGNLIYYKNKVLLTDFGSARTHYSNFTKQYSGQKEKDWQNNFLFFQTREYLEIMQEENIDFHDDMWKKLNTEDQNILSKADKWAIGIMIVQVFENSQTLPHQINQFYGLNRENLIKKLSILEYNKNIITKIVIEELLIKDLDVFTVCQSFQNHKKYIDVNKGPQQLDETHSIQEVFDKKESEFQLERNLNPEYYYMEKKKIQAMQTQYDKDDASSVASVQRPIIETIDYNVQNSDNLQKMQKKPDQLFVSQQIPKVPPKYDVIAKQNAEQILYQDDGQGIKRTGLQKPSIVVSQFQESKNIGQYHVAEQNDDENTRLINGNPASQSFKIVGYEPQQQSSQFAINDQQEPSQDLKLEKEKQTQKLEYFPSNQNQMGQVQDPFNITTVNTGRFDTNGPQIFGMQEGQNLQEVKNIVAQNPSNGIQQKTGQFGLQQNNNFNLLEIEDLDDFQNNVTPTQNNKVVESIQEKSNVINLSNIQDTENKKINFPQGSLIQFQNFDDSEKDKLNIQNLYPINDQENGVQKFPQNQSAYFPNNNVNLTAVNDNEQAQINKPQVQGQQLTENYSLNPLQQFNEMKDPDFLASKQSVWSVEQNVNQIQQQSQLVIIKDTTHDQVRAPISNLLPVEQIINQDEKKQLNQVQDFNQIKDQTPQNKSVIEAEFVQSGRIKQVEDTEQKKVFGQKLESMPMKLNGKNLAKLNPLDDKKPSGQELYVNREMRQIIDKLINPQNLREISDQGLAQELEKQQQLKNDIKEHLSNDDDVIQFDDKEMKPTSRIINQNPEQLSKLQPQQVQQLEQQVDDYLKEIQKKNQANELIKQDNIIQNPELLNMLSKQQLQKLAEKLNKQQGQQSQNLLKQVQQIQQVQEQLQQFIIQPKTKNLLSNDQIPLLNQQDLKKYYDQVKKLKEQTKNEQQRIRIQEQLKIIEQQLQISQIDNRIQQFIDHPTVENLLPEDILQLLTPEQRKKYQKALEDQLPRAPRLFKKEIEKQLDIIKNQIDKQKNKIYIAPKEIPQEKIDEKFEPPKDQNLAPEDIFQAKFNQIKKALPKDEIPLLSLNKYIRSFQLDEKLYEIREPIPQDCKEHIQGKQPPPKTDNIDNNRYQGYWSNGVPHGFGTLREEKNSAIYQGVFKQGKFYWGQVLEINQNGFLTQYIGYYHNQHNVKHGISKMIWFKPQMSRLNYKFVQQEFYEGQFILGRIYGKGKKIYSDGSFYEGEWKNNQREGKGKFVQIINNRKIIYLGSFQNDYLQGECKLIHDENKNLYEIGQYEKNKPTGTHTLFLGEKKQKAIQY